LQVFAYPEVPAGIETTSSIVVSPVEKGNALYWLGEGHLQPPEVHGERYSVVIGWSAHGGEEPEQMEGVVEHSRTSPHTVVVIRFLHAVDSDAAAALEAAAGRVCTTQVRADHHQTLVCCTPFTRGQTILTYHNCGDVDPVHFATGR
jgi:hypothetical protein